MDPLLDGLNEPQRAAVLHLDGPLLILAGPGSGKTRVITHRIVRLLHEGAPANRIAALTFTNKAAGEMQRRVAEATRGQQVPISTFHRFCARLLRRYAALVGLESNFTIYDSADSLEAVKATARALSIDLRADWGLSPEQVLSGLSRAKNSLIPLEPAELRRQLHEPLASAVALVGPAYQARLLSANAVDFDDLLRHVALMLADNSEVRARLDEHFAYVMVDEYQDTNRAQYAIVRALSIDTPNLAVTGDPDQSIYSWRGASVRNILQFERDYPQAAVIKLEQNYRSTPNILRAADALIVHNVQRKAKRLLPQRAEGAAVQLTLYESYLDEARDIAARIAAAAAEGRSLRDSAIFFRTNSLSRVLEGALRAEGVPYQVVNAVEFYQRREVKDLLAYLHLINNPRNDVALERIVNVPPRGIGERTLDTVRQESHARRTTYLEALRIVAGGTLLAPRFRKALAEFAQLYDRLAAPAGSVRAVLERILQETGYARRLAETSLEEDVDRMGNVQELLAAADEFDQNQGGDLEAFLEDKSLVADTDALGAADDRVRLMTLHSAKGLEFPEVYIVGLEHGLLPHDRSREDPEALEEERRLLFVGMTRAQDRLYLSHARRRFARGGERMTVPSEFLLELPREEMECFDRTESRPSASYAFDAPADEMEFRQTAAFLDESADEWLTTTRRRAKEKRPRAIPPLQTAAQLAAELFPAASSKGANVTAGMIVRHPDYGLGTVLAVDGQDDRRCARVRFFTSPLEKTFFLKHSALEPAQG